MTLELSSLPDTIRRYAKINLEIGTPGFLISMLLQTAHEAYGEKDRQFKIPSKDTEKFGNLYEAFLDLADGIETKNDSKKDDAYRRIAQNLEYQ